MGYLRLLLSLVVLAGHTTALPIIYAKAAVFGFYGLSGYLGTLSIATTYQGRALPFFLSRYLRIWPTYLAVFLATSTALLFWVPIDPNLRAPGYLQWVGQMFMIYMPHPLPSVAWVVPPAWMLPSLLLWWAAIALGVSRSQGTTLGWVAVSVAIAINQPTYFSPLAASLPFALGATAYHYGLKIPRDGRWAAWAGALSYPVFIVHQVVIAGAKSYDELITGWPLFFAALLPTLALSWSLVVLVERPVERYRKHLRS